MDNTCVCCGAEIPEGRQVCIACEEGFIAQNQETLSKIGDIAAQIGEALFESVDAALEALKELFSPFFDAVKDLARRFGELIADDASRKRFRRDLRSAASDADRKPETESRQSSAEDAGTSKKEDEEQ